MCGSRFVLAFSGDHCTGLFYFLIKIWLVHNRRKLASLKQKSPSSEQILESDYLELNATFSTLAV